MIFAQKNNDTLKTTNHMYAGIQLGLFGPGIQIVKPITEYVSVRLQGNYFKINKDYLTILPQSTGDVETLNSVEVKLASGGLIFDWLPFKKLKGLRVSTGLFYQTNSLGVVREYTYYEDPANRADTIQLGKLTIGLQGQKIAPYLGLVFGKQKPEKRVSAFFEMGVMYHGKMDVTFLGEGRVAPTARQKPIIESNVKNYNWYPNASFHLNFRLY